MTVIRSPVLKTKLPMNRGDISNPQRHAGQHWDWDRGEKDREAKFQRCFAEHKLRLVSFWCAKHSIPRTLTPTCVCARVTQQSPEKKPTARSSRSAALSLSPAPRSKFVYVCGVTLQVTSKTPTQHTLSPLRYISSIQPAFSGFHSC